MPKPFSPFLAWLGVGLAVAGILSFLIATPDGFLRKLDYVGAAVCHRRLSHSFVVAGRQLPLCQRCTGTFPGALTGVLIHWALLRRRRAVQFPRWTLLVPAVLFAAFWGLDGINSTTSDGQFAVVLQRFVTRPEGIGLLGYAPQPWLRLLTGALMGMAMSMILVPAFNQSLWADAEATPTLRSWHELALLIAVELGMVGVILILEGLPTPVALYAISAYSALGVVTMFTLLGAMLYALLLRRDATAHGWREAWSPLAWGVVFAVFIVVGMDAGRLLLSGTLDGVPGLD
ncbi:MAG: DUF2085 domain-containing protein [Anaerolineae bacterium]|nr:DUF2085 domain-containing protein [Anaerolineae bacterium]